jgi:hypothetical protein
MPVVIKKSDNGFVDATRKLICLPSYLGLVGERRDALRRAAAVASATAAAAAFTFASAAADGNVITLTATSPTVSAQINTGSSVGLDSLIINGKNQVNQQQVYFRVGGSPGAASSVTTLTQSAISSSATTLDVTYTGDYLTSNQFTIEEQYSLTSNTNGAGMLFTVTADNKSSVSIPLSLIEYANFTLNNSTTTNELAFSPSPTPNTATVTDGSNGVTEQNQPSTPTPNSYQGALDNPPSTILTDIGSGSFTHLSDSAPNPSTEGDASYAFEWDTTLAPTTGTESLSLNWTVMCVPVPEPTSIISVIGLAAMCGLRRPRRRNGLASAV